MRDGLVAVPPGLGAGLPGAGRARAAVVLLAFAGRRSIWLLLLTAAAVAVVLAAGFWFLQQRGVLRWVALALGRGRPAGGARRSSSAERLLWVDLVAVVLLGAAVVAARTALRPDRSGLGAAGRRRPARPAALPRHEPALGRRQGRPVRPAAAGGGARARRWRCSTGRTPTCSSWPATPSPRGADLLGVAGGDGTQALVAQVAAEHDLPFLVISAGTRNHFALDLGLDREDPSRCLDALRDGVEARIDLGDINGRPFVNNASFGAYAEIVRQPGLPRRQARHHAGRAARPAERPARRPPGGRRGRGWSSTGRRRCWSATTPTRPPISPGWADGPGSTAGRWA